MMRFGPEYSRRLYRECGPVSRQGAFGRKFVVLSGPDDTQIAMVNKDKAFSQEGWKFLMEKFFEGGVMLKDFDEHHLHRRILQQAFTRDRLAGYVGEFGPTVRESYLRRGKTRAQGSEFDCRRDSLGCQCSSEHLERCSLREVLTDADIFGPLLRS